jgi:hypothetical protein
LEALIDSCTAVTISPGDKLDGWGEADTEIERRCDEVLEDDAFAEGAAPAVAGLSVDGGTVGAKGSGRVMVPVARD